MRLTTALKLRASSDFRLHRATHDAVRSYLCRKYPQLFILPVIQSHGQLVATTDLSPDASLGFGSDSGISNGNSFGQWLKEENSSVMTKEKDEAFHRPLQSSTAHLPLRYLVDQLARLNGYQKVSVNDDRLALAEGVVAVRNVRFMRH